MTSEKQKNSKWEMVELPGGITTSRGSWYHITSSEIEKYVPGLLNLVSLEKIIKEADAWLNSPAPLAILVYFLSYFLGLEPLYACFLSVAFFVFWHSNVSAFVSAGFTPFIKLANSDVLIYFVSGALLIWMSFNEQLTALWYGLGVFFIIKPGLLKLLISTLFKNKFERSDRVLNMLLIRYGMKEGILTGAIKEMERQFFETSYYHKSKKK